MAELVDIFQQVAQNVVEGLKLADKATGTVESAAPLRVKIDTSMQSIPEAGLLLTDAVRERTVSVQGGGGGTVTVTESLKPGDRVLMLRVQGGNQYIILSKIT